MRSEIPSGMCAKLRTVAASNNRVQMPFYYCLFALHICMVLFFMHIPFVVEHTINATPPEWLQQHPLLFTIRTDRTFFVWRLNSARPSHPGHTILLRSEIPSGMCAKLRTVAASIKQRTKHPNVPLSQVKDVFFSLSCSYPDLCRVGIPT